MAKVKASCHCGACQIEVETPEHVTSCTCTFCSKRGALWAYYPKENVTFLQPVQHDASYSKRGFAHHHFCANCGCTTYSESPSWVDFKPDYEHMRISVNARLIDDLDPATLRVETIDGRNLW